MTPYRRVCLFDDCDSNILGSWEKEDREKRFPAIVKLLARVLFSDADTDWELCACLGKWKYTLSKKEQELSEEKCDWLTNEAAFDQVLGKVPETMPDHDTLFLIDWSMGNLQWGGDARSAASILSKLSDRKASLRGTVVCFTSDPDADEFKEGYKAHAKPLSDGVTVTTMKMMWRWNDIESTFYTLRKMLKKNAEKAKGLEP